MVAFIACIPLSPLLKHPYDIEQVVTGEGNEHQVRDDPGAGEGEGHDHETGEDVYDITRRKQMILIGQGVLKTYKLGRTRYIIVDSIENAIAAGQS